MGAEDTPKRELIREIESLKGRVETLTDEERALRACAESRDKALGGFLDALSYEIRTPLNSVLGMIELALMTGLSLEVREYLQMARQAGRSLLALVDDIHDLSRIETGEVALAEDEFDIRAAVREAARPFVETARDKGISVAVSVASEVPERVLGDSARLRQILGNLLDNAVKFTDAGRISLRAALDRQNGSSPVLAEPGRVRLLFTVRDTGIGIPAKDLGTVFESFAHVDSPAHLRHGGTGLGLSVCRRLVGLMGGEIRIRSDEGKGTTLTFSVELRTVEEPAPGPESRGHPAVRPLRVLLVEDNLVNRILAESLLGKRGHSVAVAGNGREALDKLSRDDFDVILMDIRMPEMSGEEATRVIRTKFPPGKRDIPIIAVTAYAMRGDRERLIEAGMTDYIAKPIDLAELDRALAKAAEAEAGPPG